MGLMRRFLLIFVVWIILLLIAIQTASHFFLAAYLEREGRKLLKAPVRIQHAWFDILTATLWMKEVRVKNVEGFREPDIFSAKRLSIDLSLISLLTNQLVVNQIRMDDPVFNLEMRANRQTNYQPLVDRIKEQIKKLSSKKWKYIHWVVRYELNRFRIQDGTFVFADDSDGGKRWEFNITTFTLRRVVFPPDPEEALPAAVYLKGTIQGIRPTKLLAVGRLNFVAKEKSFDIVGWVKDASLPECNRFLGGFPLVFSEGSLQLKIKALCHENQLDIRNEVSIDHLKLADLRNMKPSAPKTPVKPTLAFDLPPDTVLYFFTDVQKPEKPFEFDFRVTGNLGEPNFNLLEETRKSLDQTIYELIIKKMEEMTEGNLAANQAVSRMLKDNVPSIKISGRNE